jgi:hypothetical protein
MRKAIQGIDHAVLAVHDLDAAADTFRRLGFTLTPKGYHDLGSQNHCIMLGGDYVEIVAVPRPHPFNQYYLDFLAHGEGLAATALKTDDARKASIELGAAGFSPSEPLVLSRPVESPRGKREAKFSLVTLPLQATPGHRMFLCQHHTRELVWQSHWQAHANSAGRLAAIAIADRDPTSLAHSYQRIFDAPVREIPEGVKLDIGETSLAFVTDGALARRLPGLWISGRPQPAAVALFVHVADREEMAQTLRRGGFHSMRMPDGSVAVGATEAHGVALVFG